MISAGATYVIIQGQENFTIITRYTPYASDVPRFRQYATEVQIMTMTNR
jgi:hypothetical protein